MLNSLSLIHHIEVAPLSCVEQLDPDDTLHMEAYEKLLDTWLSLVEDTDSFPSSLIQPQAAKVFSSYMMCHLSPPHGNRQTVSY